MVKCVRCNQYARYKGVARILKGEGVKEMHSAWKWKPHPLIADRLGARLLILLRISFCIGMYVCTSVTLRNVNFRTLSMCISASCTSCVMCAYARGIIAYTYF